MVLPQRLSVGHCEQSDAHLQEATAKQQWEMMFNYNLGVIYLGGLKKTITNLHVKLVQGPVSWMFYVDKVKKIKRNNAIDLFVDEIFNWLIDV